MWLVQTYKGRLKGAACERRPTLDIRIWGQLPYYNFSLLPLLYQPYKWWLTLDIILFYKSTKFVASKFIPTSSPRHKLYENMFWQSFMPTPLRCVACYCYLHGWICAHNTCNIFHHTNTMSNKYQYLRVRDSRQYVIPHTYKCRLIFNTSLQSHLLFVYSRLTCLWAFHSFYCSLSSVNGSTMATLHLGFILFIIIMEAATTVTNISHASLHCHLHCLVGKLALSQNCSKNMWGVTKAVYHFVTLQLYSNITWYPSLVHC